MKYAAIDTEGSGLFDYTKPADAPGQPRMAALGLILLDDDLKTEAAHGWLIRPDGWVFDDNNEAAKVNGLTHDQLMAEGVDVMTALREYENALDARRIIVGFNVLHDLKTLRAELRYKQREDRFMQTRYICVMQGCRQLVDARTAAGKKKAPKLEEACAHFGIELEEKGAHTGLGGADRAAQILIKLRDLGAMPEFKDPYEKTSAPKQAHRAVLDRQATSRRTGADYEQDIIRQQQDEEMLNNGFISGANEDGK